MPDPILLWNEVALEANRVSHTNGQGEQAGPPLSARALAVVHLAMYDALAGVAKTPKVLPPYMPGLPDAGKASTIEDAVAAAAHGTLCSLFPSQRPVFDFVLSLAGAPGSAGHEFGVAVAKAILDDRKDDPGVSSAGYKPPTGRGKHRPDPDNPDQGFHAPDYGRRSKGFAITKRFELATPPFDNAEYLEAVKQVRGKGIKPELMGTLPSGIAARTNDETVAGLYWGYDGAAHLGTPPRLYNQIVRQVAQKRKNSTADNARLLALVNVAMADAGILSWDQKYIHEFWRPVLGVREHDPSTGPAAEQGSEYVSVNSDPSWLPLGAPKSNSTGKNFTPPFPAYPSGHATFGAAALHATRLFYHQGGTFAKLNLGADELFDGCDFVSEELNGVTRDNLGTIRPRHRRKFADGLWGMILENGLSRVFLGVHWMFDAFVLGKDGKPDLYRTDKAGNTIGGVPLGILVAEDILGVNGKAPAKSSVGPRGPAAPTAPTRTATHGSNYLR